MVEISGFTSNLMNWLVNPLIWLIILGVMFGGTVGFLMIRKRRRLIFPTIEVLDLGIGKTCLNVAKSGWFGRKTVLFGLIDYGEQVLKMNGKEIIHDFSTEDYEEVNRKRGVICYRNPIKQNVLVPINHVTVTNKELVADIAPADYTNTAVEIINEATKETRDWKAQLMVWLAIGGIIVFALVSIIVITQMVQRGQKEASELIVKAGETCLTNAKDVCGAIFSQIASKAP